MSDRALVLEQELEIIYLLDKIHWFGAHTGYERLHGHLDSTDIKFSSIHCNGGLMKRVVGKAYSIWNRLPARNQKAVAAELRLALKPLRTGQLRHILYLEGHLPYFKQFSKASINTVGTIHLPPSQWNNENLEMLSKVRNALILYRRDIPFFEKYIGRGNVRFVHHGVEIDFFKPNPERNKKAHRLLFSGHYLRNPEMFYRVAKRLTGKHASIQLDVLVPERFRNLPGFNKFCGISRLHWHANISDEDLNALIARSYLLVLPMNDSGANTAITEALSCGTPPVTTDVGGIRDYGGGEIFPLVNNEDDNAMVELIERYLDEPDWHQAVSANCRAFAEQNLAWPVVAKKHGEIYEDILCGLKS